MTTAHETTFGQSSEQRWPIAALAYAVAGGLVATVLTTVIGKSLTGFTTLETTALAAGSTGLVAAVCWYYYIDRRDPADVREAAESTSVFVGMLVPCVVWIGFTVVTLPQQLLAAPGVSVGMGLMIVFHSVWLALPVSFVVGTALGRIYD